MAVANTKGRIKVSFRALSLMMIMILMMIMMIMILMMIHVVKGGIRETNCGMKRKRGRVQGRNPSSGSYIAITIKDIKDNEDKEVYQDQEGFPISCFMHHQPYRLSSLPLSLDMIYARLPSLPIPIQKSAQRWTIPIQNGLCSFKVSQLNPPTRKTIHC